MSAKFENVGWRHIDISAPAQKRVERELQSAGAKIDSFQISDIVTGYKAFKNLSEYESEYKAYAGPLEHCFLQKSLEHYLSLLLVNPKPGMVGIDIGSCQSVLPVLSRRVYGVRYLEQDLVYPAGVNGDRIGSSAADIPMPNESVDFMTLHCTFEHFENDADIGFVKECARLLKDGGKVVILPLYMCENFCNITGETNEEIRGTIDFDATADHYCIIPEWQNRFGRHYSSAAFMERVWHLSVAGGLNPRLYKIDDWSTVHPDLWLRWALVLEREFR